MNDFIINGSCLSAYKGTEEQISIPKGVTKIGDEAFINSNIKDISFNESLRDIGVSAFKNCRNLKKLNLPSGLIEIEDTAFLGCDNLQYVYIPASVSFIGSNIFQDNTKIVVIGETESLAETYASDNKLIFKTDKRKVEESFDKLEKMQKRLDSKDIIILGEKIRCTNSQSIYNDTCNYYEERKSLEYKGLLHCLPENSDASFIEPTFLYSVIDKMIERLEKKGIYTTHIGAEVFSAYNKIMDLFSAFGNYVLSVKKGGLSDYKEFVSSTYQAAQDKATGLSYGVIGGASDIALYSLDNLIETRKQLKNNFAEAQASSSQYQNEVRLRMSKSIKEGYDEIKKPLEEAVNQLMDALCSYENECMSEAGVIDLDVNKSFNPLKSERYLNDKSTNVEYKVSTALKYNPSNINAYKEAFDNGLLDDAFIEMATFVGCTEQLKNLIITSINQSIQDGRHPVDILRLVDRYDNQISENDKEKIYTNLKGKVLYQAKKIAGSNLNAGDEDKVYIENKARGLLTIEDLSALSNHSVVSPFSNDCTWTYESITEYMTQHRTAQYPLQEIYDEACKKVETARTEEDYRAALIEFEKIPKYKGVKERIKQINGWLNTNDKYKQAIKNLSEAQGPEDVEKCNRELESLNFGDSQHLSEKCKEYLQYEKDKKPLAGTLLALAIGVGFTAPGVWVVYGIINGQSLFFSGLMLIAISVIIGLPFLITGIYGLYNHIVVQRQIISRIEVKDLRNEAKAIKKDMN